MQLLNSFSITPLDLLRSALSPTESAPSCRRQSAEGDATRRSCLPRGHHQFRPRNGVPIARSRFHLDGPHRQGAPEIRGRLLACFVSKRCDAEVQIRDAGNAVSIRGSHQVPEQNASVRFVRIWVKRPEAWQLLIYQETTKQRRIPKSAAGLALQATAHRSVAKSAQNHSL